jgi:hypothetical protein
MDDQDDFEFWCAEYRDNPDMSEPESIRILKSMCSEGNSVAIAYWERAQRREITLLNEYVDAFDALSIAPSSALLEPDLSPDDLDGHEHGVRSGFIEPTENNTASPDSPPAADYPDNWTEISDQMKSTREWRCEICRFHSYSGLIQTHHINRDKADNQRSNLQVLCAVCHGKEHNSGPLWPIGTPDEAKNELRKHHAGTTLPSRTSLIFRSRGQ